jgi:cobyric acid synthase
MLVRDSNWGIIFLACWQLFHYRDVIGTELHAVFEELPSVLQWCNEPLIVEMDCVEQKEVDRLAYSHIVEEIKTLLMVTTLERRFIQQYG